MKNFKLSPEDIQRLEARLKELYNLFVDSGYGYEDDEEGLFENVVIDHLDEMINEYES